MREDICDNTFDHCMLIISKLSVIKVTHRFHDDILFELFFA